MLSHHFFLRFTDHYFFRDDGLTNYKTWFDKIAYILANYNKIPGDIIASQREREFIIGSIHFIYKEYLSQPDNYTNDVITGSVASILNVLARNVEKRYMDQASVTDDRFGEIPRNINSHIGENQRLRTLPEKSRK